MVDTIHSTTIMEKFNDLRSSALQAKYSFQKAMDDYTCTLVNMHGDENLPFQHENISTKLNLIKNEYEKTHIALDQHIAQLAKFLSNMFPDAYGTYYVLEYLHMWKKSHSCFAAILLNINNNGYFEKITVNQVIEASKKNQYIEQITLSEENGDIYLIGPDGFKSSPCFACHVSSGSKYKENYRHVNFMTRGGSVYYGSGYSMNHESCKLLDKLLILSK